MRGRAGTAEAGRPQPSWRRALGRLRGDPDAGTDWLTRLFNLGLLIALGVIVGMQLVAPDKRMISIIVALVLFGIAWRIDLVSGLGVLIVVMTYPRGTVFGSTNVVLVLLISVIWLLRVSLRRAAPPRGSKVDAPLLALLMAFVVSFYNVEPGVMPRAFEAMGQLLACVALFYMIVNNVRTPAQLERLLTFQAISVAVCGLLGLYELIDPTATVVPGWIQFFHGPRSEAINTHNLRVGGAFTDFELFSEYAALNLLLMGFLTVRARSTARRVAFGSLTALMWLMMFATVTRGGTLSLGLGVLFLGWMVRRRLDWVRVAIIGFLLIVSFVAVNFAVSHLTKAGDLLARFLDPQSVTFENGMPVARAPIWEQAFTRMMQHPIIGHGPVYTLEHGLSYWYWPHNGYLYIGNLVGFVGLSFFLWLMARLWMISRPVTDDLRDPNFARAYLIIGHAQMLVFLIDQTKIDFMRNTIYPFQVWLMFGTIAVAARIAEQSSTVVATPPIAAAPARRALATR